MVTAEGRYGDENRIVMKKYFPWIAGVAFLFWLGSVIA
jgi:hypothetical protein